MEATTGSRRAGRRDVRSLSRHQVLGLIVQFVLGMAEAGIGQPSETTGGARTASTVFLALHVLVAVGLVAGSVMIIMAARSIEGPRRMMAHWGALAVLLTFAAGVVTMITKSNMWSYTMAAGFAVSLVFYLVLLVTAGSPARQPE